MKIRIILSNRRFLDGSHYHRTPFRASNVFAFAIKMPLLHRLATLRDDVVFVIWLVQAFVLYPTDNKRVNEFGQVVDPNKRKELEEKEKAENQEGEKKKDK